MEEDDLRYVKRAKLALESYKFVRDHEELPIEAKAGYMAAAASVDPHIKLDHLTLFHLYTVFLEALKGL